MKLIDLISEIKPLRPDWSERYIITQIELKRAQMLKNRLNQLSFVNDMVSQTLNVEFDIADQSEFPDISSGARVLKSKTELPSLIAEHNRHAFLSVRNPNVLSSQFTTLSSVFEAVYAGNGKTNRRAVFCFIYNKYLYIKLQRTNPKIALLTNASVQGVFEYPTEVFQFQDSTIVGRDLWFQEYPINAADWNYIKGLILNGVSEEQVSN